MRVMVRERRGVVIAGDDGIHVLMGEDLEENIRMGDEVIIVMDTGPFTADYEATGKVVGLVARVQEYDSYDRYD